MSFNEFVKQVRQEPASRVRSALAFIKSQARMYLGFYSTTAPMETWISRESIASRTLALMAGNYRIRELYNILGLLNVARHGHRPGNHQNWFKHPFPPGQRRCRHMLANFRAWKHQTYVVSPTRPLDNNVRFHRK